MEKDIRPIFSRNSHPDKNAFLNWRTNGLGKTGQLLSLADGFEQAAKELLKTVLSDNRTKKGDTLILPILYAIDQSIELYLKAILNEIEILSGEEPCNYKTHDIESLYKSFLSKMNKRGEKASKLSAHLNTLQAYIGELYSHIRTHNSKGREQINIDFSRYPYDIEGNPHFYIATTEDVVIDLENLDYRFSSIIDILDGFATMFEEQIAFTSESISE